MKITKNLDLLQDIYKLEQQNREIISIADAF